MCSIKKLGSKHLLNELSEAYIVHAKETQKFLYKFQNCEELPLWTGYLREHDFQILLRAGENGVSIGISMQPNGRNYERGFSLQ